MMEIINDLLLQAVQGESEAEQRYLAFSDQAAQEGLPGVATLFTGLSHGESIHIANHKRALLKNGYQGQFKKVQLQSSLSSTLLNLGQAILGEREEFTTMYPLFSRQIKKKHGDNFIAKIALLSIKWAAESEKNHYLLLQEAEKKVQGNQDLHSGNIYLCAVCGNLHYSAEPPNELCPVCGHDTSFYSQVDILL